MIHLDTHVVCWLFQGETKKISAAARALIESNPIAVSPFVELELCLLAEIKRIDGSPAEVLHILGNELGLQILDTPLPRIVSCAHQLTWTRDPFDRLIVAQAIADKARLVSADAKIRAHFEGAVW